MIERIPDLPGHVVGLVAHGTVTATDYRDVLEPVLEDDYAAARKPRVLFVLDSDFTGFTGGAMWRDLRFGVGHLGGWDRIAIVGDPDWITHLVDLAKHVVPKHLEVFPLDQRDAAVEWLTD